MRRSASGFLVAFVGVLLVPATGMAFETLFNRVRGERDLASIFADGEAVADVEGGILIGRGHERWQRLPNGAMRVERVWKYTHLRHPELGTVHALPEPWNAVSTLEMSASLRLLRADTALHFHRSADRVLKDYAISEERPKLFEWNRSSTRSNAAGTELTRTTYLNKKLVEQDTYDYEPDVIPMEIAPFYLSVALKRGIEKFEFELLLPGGSEHSIRAVVHRTRDIAKLAREYRLPRRYFERKNELAVVDLRLSAVLKHAFFPHHIYMAFSAADPTQIDRIWGGDPDEPLEAFRIQ